MLNQSFQDWLPLLLKACAKTQPDEINHHIVCWNEPLQKLLFSATLNSNPEKIRNLDLNNPVYIALNANNDDSFKMAFHAPLTLDEFILVADDAIPKPLLLLHLLFTRNLSKW